MLEGFASFEDPTVRRRCCGARLTPQLADNVPLIYPLAVDLLARDLAPEVRAALRTLLYRIGVVSGFVRCVGIG